jgi:hypothetical protein
MIRGFFAIIVGNIAGLLLTTAVGAGIQYRFPDEFTTFKWGLLLWGEHWFLRALTSFISSAFTGYIAGLIGRNKGRVLAIIAVFPSWIVWIVAEYTAITGHFPLINGGDVYVSLGNKIFMGFIILTILPVAWWSGFQGQITGREYSTHFDSKKHSLLGIKWYHYTWIPIILYLIMMQGSFSGLYFLTWVKALWKLGVDRFFLGAIIPTVFTMALYGTLFLMAKGVQRAYLILAGFENIPSKRKVAVKVLKYAVGYQAIATVLQIGIEYVHYTLGKWLS